MKKTLPKRKMIRYCLSDIAKGLFNGKYYYLAKNTKSSLR